MERTNSSLCNNIIKHWITRCNEDLNNSILFTPSDNIYMFELSRTSRGIKPSGWFSGLQARFSFVSSDSSRYNNTSGIKCRLPGGWMNGSNSSQFYFMLHSKGLITGTDKFCVNTDVSLIKAMEVSWSKSGYVINKIKRVTKRKKKGMFWKSHNRLNLTNLTSASDETEDMTCSQMEIIEIETFADAISQRYSST